MVYRKKHLDYLTIRYINYIPKLLKLKLKQSIKKNFYANPKVRTSLFIQPKFKNKSLKFYKTQNKLRCIFTYTRSVPNHKLQLSRFYMVSRLNRLLISSAQK